MASRAACPSAGDGDSSGAKEHTVRCAVVGGRSGSNCVDQRCSAPRGAGRGPGGRRRHRSPSRCRYNRTPHVNRLPQPFRRGVRRVDDAPRSVEPATTGGRPGPGQEGGDVMSDRVGSVSRTRYEDLVAEARELIAQVTKAQFALGDKALLIEPMRPGEDQCPGRRTTCSQSRSRTTPLETAGHATADRAGMGRFRLRRPAHQLVRQLPQHDPQNGVPPPADRKASSSCPGAGKSNGPWAGS